MAFTDKDRETLAQVRVDIVWIKEEHGKRLEKLETEDKVLHARINRVRNLYMGASAGIGVIAGAIAIWIKSNFGGR